MRTSDENQVRCGKDISSSPRRKRCYKSIPRAALCFLQGRRAQKSYASQFGRDSLSQCPSVLIPPLEQRHKIHLKWLALYCKVVRIVGGAFESEFSLRFLSRARTLHRYSKNRFTRLELRTVFTSYLCFQMKIGGSIAVVGENGSIEVTTSLWACLKI